MWTNSILLRIFVTGRHVRFNVSGNVTQRTITDLREGARYSFIVSARTLVGLGHSIERQIVIGPQPGGCVSLIISVG